MPIREKWRAARHYMSSNKSYVRGGEMAMRGVINRRAALRIDAF